MVSDSDEKAEGGMVIKHAAWNVLKKPVSEAEMRATLQRYGEYILLVQNLAALKVEFDAFRVKVNERMAKQQKLIWALVIAIIIVLGGSEVGKLLLPLF